MRALLLLTILILLVSCSPAKRLRLLLKNHPELTSHDTIWKDTTIFIPTKEISGDIELDKDFSELLKMIDQYKGSVDSLAGLKLKSDIKYYITNKPVLMDTVKIDSLGLHLRLFDKGGKLVYALKMDSLNQRFRYSQAINNVETKVEEVSLWGRILQHLNILILILLILVLIRR